MNDADDLESLFALMGGRLGSPTPPEALQPPGAWEAPEVVEAPEADATFTGTGDASVNVDDILGALLPRERPRERELDGQVTALVTRPRRKGTFMAHSEQELAIEPAVQLPDNVVPHPFAMIATFNLKCEIDAKKVCFGIRQAEFNPRKRSAVTLRMIDPVCTASIRETGSCSMSAKISCPEDEQLIKRNAKKLVRLMQKLGYAEAKCADWKVSSMLFRVPLTFPVNLKRIALEWRRNAVYEPETYCGCIFKLAQPQFTYLITHGGRIIISGCRKIEEAWDATRRIYPVVVEYQKPPLEVLCDY